MTRRKRRLSQQDLRAAGVSPGLLVHRVGPDGRARLEQLTSEAEGSGKPPLFKAQRLTNHREDTGHTQDDEGENDGS